MPFPYIHEAVKEKERKNLKGLFGFSFFHHSSLLTQFSSLILITHHLKYPNFLYPTRLAHVFSFSSLKFFYDLWDSLLEHHVSEYS